ncbi:SDR family oxidoreductase [Limibaculum sp. M0105]|uniref:SDR family oxidoreductase n=1 Tax=Thermohalobaculum xanthum TaxID=2753746 RepID=A0A8J7M922_9RHOB|nr:SDR family oxidoreductase [Thermohalobaculum xanthum]MBK0400388.1 SDR family oxidoreductase [Thermohalobaculum xanthum]
MSETAGRVALVTGASSGIGAATVRALAEAGWHVHAVARRADRLRALSAETGAVAHALDVTDTGALERLAGEVAPDLLVNNAGLGAGIAGLDGATEDDIARTIGVNVAALLQVLRVFLPGMRARGRGHVVNLGSVAGLYPNQSAIYGASKGAVRQLSRNLRLELRGTGIRVTEIQPGRVATEFYDAAIPRDPATRARLKTTRIRELAPEDVAAAILFAASAPAHVNVSAIELQPVEQTFGGVSFDPLGD